MFDEFKFKLGDLVCHKTCPIRFLVVRRVLKEHSNGNLSRHYIGESLLQDAFRACEFPEDVLVAADKE